MLKVKDGVDRGGLSKYGIKKDGPITIDDNGEITLHGEEGEFTLFDMISAGLVEKAE